jgi:hypothetical protein
LLEVALYRNNEWVGMTNGDWHTWTFQLAMASGLMHGWKVCGASLSDPFA